MLKEGYKKYEFGYIPNDWKIKKIGDIYDDLKAGATPSRTNPSYFTGDIPWITSGELKSKYIYDTYEKITEEAVKNTNLKIYQKGTFFIAITGLEAAGTRGSCGINGIDSATNQSCLAFQEKEEINTEFLYYWYSLYGDYIGKKYTQGTKQQSLNNKIVEELCIGFPNKEEQEKIADILSTVDCQIDDTEMFIEKCQELKKGLMQKLLTKGIGHTEFKKTEVGEIPVNWEVKKLNECGIIIGGNAFKSSKFKVEKHSRESYQVIRMGNVQQDKLNTSKNPVYLLKTDLIDKEEKYILKKYDVLISLTGTVNKTDYGNVAEIKEDDRYLLNQRVACIRNNSDGYINKYLYYIMKSTKFRKQFFELGVGGTGNQANVSINDLSLIKIPIPSVDEQQKIVEILSGIDNEIEEYEKKKQNLEELKKGLMQQLLKGKIRTV